MTTNVKITNEGPGTIRIYESFETPSDDITNLVVELPPGGMTLTYVWKDGRNLLIKEEKSGH